MARVDARERRLRDEQLLEAGLARGILSLVNPDDPMKAKIEKDGYAPWHFADRDLTIEFRPESGKLDLETGEPHALGGLLNKLLGPSLGAAALDTVLVARRQGRTPATPDLILPLTERASHLGASLRDHLTVYGGRTGTEQRSGPTEKPAASGGTGSCYTIRVRLIGEPRARAETVLIDPGSHRFAILDRADLLLEDTDLQDSDE